MQARGVHQYCLPSPLRVGGDGCLHQGELAMLDLAAV